MRIVIFGLCLALAPGLFAEPRFIAPDDSYPLLRRDLIPLDVDGIQELASHLAVLGDGPAPAVAEQLREKAKILTLSQRLSPTEPRTRAALRALIQKESRPAPSIEDLEFAKKTSFSAAQWLIDLPAESEGNHLGQLLLDVLAPISPTNPMTQRRDVDGEASRWRGVIANLSDFAGTPMPRNEKSDMPLPLPTASSDSPDSPKASPAYQITELLTGIPMLCKDIPQTSPVVADLVKTSLIITKGDEFNNGLRFQPKPGFDLGPLNSALKEFFESAGNPLPQEFHLNINTDGRQYVSGNKENIAAPIAMMLDSALTGRALRKNTFLFAGLNVDGTLDRPSEAWEMLLKLIETKVPRGSRLIVGPGLDEELTALLVFQKAEFFVNYEVICAPTFELARTLFYNDGAPSSGLTTAMAGYDEVRQKAFIATSIPTFLGLNAVEERLVKARDASPLHLSARMLATQAIRRPAYLSEYMLAQEIDHRLKPLSSFKYIPTETTDRDIREIYKQTRESIQPLERMIELRQEALFKEALDLIQQLNSVARISDNSLQTIPAMAKFRADLDAFRAKLRSLYDKNSEK